MLKQGLYDALVRAFTTVAAIMLASYCHSSSGDHLASHPSLIADDQRIDIYQHRLEKMLANFGPYHAQLSELYNEQALALQQLEQHQAALDYFNRALHVVRINEGLYAANQQVIFKRAIDSSIALEDWPRVANYVSRWQWLIEQNPNVSPELFIRSARAIASVHMHAFFNDNTLSDASRVKRLVQANHAINTALALLENSDQPSTQAIPWLFDLSIAAFYLSTASQNHLSLINNTWETIDSSKTNDFQKLSPSFDGQNSNDDKRHEFVAEQYQIGKSAIESIIAIYQQSPQADLQQRFNAEMLLADWHLLFNLPEHAHNQYQRAYSQYKPQPKAIDAKPVILPNLAWSKSGQEPTSTALDTPSVQLSFEINRLGEARNFKILDTQSNNQAQIDYLIQSLKHKRFRPIISGGRITQATQVTRRFYLAPKLTPNNHKVARH